MENSLKDLSLEEFLRLLDEELLIEDSSLRIQDLPAAPEALQVGAVVPAQNSPVPVNAKFSSADSLRIFTYLIYIKMSDFSEDYFWEGIKDEFMPKTSVAGSEICSNQKCEQRAQTSQSRREDNASESRRETETKEMSRLPLQSLRHPQKFPVRIEGPLVKDPASQIDFFLVCS